MPREQHSEAIPNCGVVMCCDAMTTQLVQCDAADSAATELTLRCTQCGHQVTLPLADRAQLQQPDDIVFTLLAAWIVSLDTP